MKKTKSMKLLSLILAMMMVMSLFSVTGMTAYASGQWDGGTYNVSTDEIINNDIYVDDDATLTIESGVTLTITATCKNDGCDLTDSKVALTIAKPEKEKYGDSKEAKATLTGLDAFTTATGLNVSADDIEYLDRDNVEAGKSKTAPTNAGKCSASLQVTISETESWSITVMYEIAKADTTYTVPTGLKAVCGDTLESVTLPTGLTWADNSTLKRLQKKK